jgi:very-short-patch-repair endonuclease
MADLVKELISRAADHLAKRCREDWLVGNAGDYYSAEELIALHKLESPLELIFLLFWDAEVQPTPMSTIDSYLLRIDKQVPFTLDGRDVRFDFVVRPSDAVESDLATAKIASPRYVIEVDGHTFHERTPEQVAERNWRDRAIQKQGWKAFHFSWREFTSNPERQIEELVTTIRLDILRLQDEARQRLDPNHNSLQHLARIGMEAV